MSLCSCFTWYDSWVWCRDGDWKNRIFDFCKNYFYSSNTLYYILWNLNCIELNNWDNIVIKQIDAVFNSKVIINQHCQNEIIGLHPHRNQINSQIFLMIMINLYLTDFRNWHEKMYIFCAQYNILWWVW